MLTAIRPPPPPRETLLTASSSPPFALMRELGPVTSARAISATLPPDPAPPLPAPLPPSARTAPAMTKRARSFAPLPPRSSAAPPPFAPAVQQLENPAPPDPRSAGAVIEPYVAFEGPSGTSGPTPPYDAD